MAREPTHRTGGGAGNFKMAAMTGRKEATCQKGGCHAKRDSKVETGCRSLLGWLLSSRCLVAQMYSHEHVASGRHSPRSELLCTATTSRPLSSPISHGMHPRQALHTSSTCSAVAYTVDSVRTVEIVVVQPHLPEVCHTANRAWNRACDELSRHEFGQSRGVITTMAIDVMLFYPPVNPLWSSHS